jgi:outer membrane lipoprotein carrier protein
MKKQWAFALLAAWAAAAGAAGMDSLEAFVKGAKSGKAEFTQVVTSPSRDGQAARTKTSSGTFEFSRPNRFRFHYKKPFEQTIVADGQTLWLHDVDLNQVTARKQAAVLGTTPAALIAAAPDLGALQKDLPCNRRPTGTACSGCKPRPGPGTASCSMCAWASRARISPRWRSWTALASVRC